MECNARVFRVLRLVALLRCHHWSPVPFKASRTFRVMYDNILVNISSELVSRVITAGGET